MRVLRSPFPAWRNCAVGIASTIAISAGAAGALEPVESPAAESPELRAVGMTYVGSRGPTSELVLNARFATFYPDRDFADLSEVRAVFTDDADGENFEMTCDHAELNVETNDFRAEGQVRGTTSSGQQYAAPWVEYDDASGLLHTDAPVVMVDETGTFRGVGFVYRVEDRTFKLLGNVSVVQTP
jgi:LPS export ABC transporter protein LptC